ncbi:putative cyclase domain-containing protein [Trichoderma compactum]
MAFMFPDFDDLPEVPHCPKGCVWGFYDRDGVKDQVGSLNLLTTAVVKAASSEIETGRHVQLDWPLEALKFPGFGRRTINQKVIDSSATLNEYALDDELHLNTQSGSQWDSLKHYAYQKGQMFYNGLSYQEAKTSDRNGIHNWCERGGIVGRGILVDMVRHYEKTTGKVPDAWSTFEITVSDLEAALAHQGTVPRQGDILLIRSGYIKRHNESTDDERRAGTQQNSHAIGLAPSEETVRWLYKHHFAAMAGDTVAFEAWPRDMANPWALHEWCLVWWGTPLGELWNLEELSRQCEQHSRWSFFLTSAPLNVRGGVGSPPGAIAIF